MATTYDQLVVRIAEAKHELATLEVKYREAVEGTRRGQPHDAALVDKVDAARLKLRALEHELDGSR